MASNESSSAGFHRSQLFDLKGKVALVTGAGTGIGLMITQALAANGAKVYITGRTEDKLQKVVELYGSGIEGEIIPLPGDVTKKDDIIRLHKEFSSREKCLCILVNNAGIDSHTFQHEAKNAEEFKQNMFDPKEATLEDWESVYKTNVSSVYFMTTAFMPLLQKSTDSHKGWSSTVINIASISGMVKNPQHHFQYNASKAATLHLTRMLANTVAESGIKVRINAISPGVFPSEMTAGDSGEDQKSFIPKDKYADKVPAARPGKDEDMAQTALFFACNQYLNGQNVAVDGGYTLAAGL